MTTWFITGCSTGFGRLLTLASLDAGETVIATARRQDDLTALSLEARGKPGTLHTFVLDVTVEGAARTVVAQALTYAGQIDVLVNNAGYGYMATQEEGDLDEVQAMYAVNVFGLMRTTQAVLPSMRSCGSGTIVNLSSIAGRLGSPRGGFYQSSKWAVECISQSLFLETSRFGLKVRVIEPGAYDTDFGGRSIRIQPTLLSGGSAYSEVAKEWAEAAGSVFRYPRGAGDPREVVEAIRAGVARPEGFLRIPVGRDTIEFLANREGKSDAEYFAMLKSWGYGRGPGE